MRSRIVWIPALTFLLDGLCSIARQKSSTEQAKKPAAQTGVASATSTSGVRMYAHHDTDHFNDQDHCISFDKPGNEKPLFVEVDLNSDPGSDPTMDLAFLYTRLGDVPHSEILSSSCQRIGPGKTTCRARFDEKITNAKSDPQQEIFEWHLGDEPDGVYSTAGTLNTTVALKANVGVPGLFTYTFRNPNDCNAAFSKPKLK